MTALPAPPGLPEVGPLTLGEALAAVAWLIPPGRALSYGDLARLLGRGGPRQAGRAMAEADPGTPWWRVVRADGTLPGDLAARAAVHHAEEGTPRTAGGRVDLARARWSPGLDPGPGDEARLDAVARLSARIG